MYRILIKGRFFRLETQEEFDKALMRNDIADIEFVI